MGALTAYIAKQSHQVLRTAIDVLIDELKRNKKEVEANIKHLDDAEASGDNSKVMKAINDVGLNRDECENLCQAIEKDIGICKSIDRSAFKRNSVYGDKVLKAAYPAFKRKGQVIDLMTNVGKDVSCWRLAECKFAVKLFTSKMFTGRLTFVSSIDTKFRDVVLELQRDGERYLEEFTIYVVSEHYQQCLRQLNNLIIGGCEPCLVSNNYRIRTVQQIVA